jgi:hypothetical protein
MKCPACAIQMVVVEVKGIEVDRCPSCEGIVLDRGETEELDALGLAGVVDRATPAEATATQPRPTAARCFSCERDMIALKGAGDIEYDWCDGCERLFFDRGELAAIAAFADA